MKADVEADMKNVMIKSKKGIMPAVVKQENSPKPLKSASLHFPQKKESNASTNRNREKENLIQNLM